MSLQGFKKQINKVNQFVTEKMGKDQGTELDDDFQGMEKRMDLMKKITTELITKTGEYLQPNPAIRTKLWAADTISRVRGAGAQSHLYIQPEASLGASMMRNGREIKTLYGECLCEAGESMKQIGDYKFALEDNVKQNFLEPLFHIQQKDLKEVAYHRKKLVGRRLDYDCKKRRKEQHAIDSTKVDRVDHDIEAAGRKFEESKTLAERAMFNLLENDEEHISGLIAFVEAQAKFHRNCLATLEQLTSTLQQKRAEATDRPESQHEVKPVFVSRTSSGSDIGGSGGGGRNSFTGNRGSNFMDMDNNDLLHQGTTPTGNNSSSHNSWGNGASASGRPYCEALYDFDAESPEELSFKEGGTIFLKSDIDENWFEGEYGGKTGIFPKNYVKVVIPVS